MQAQFWLLIKLSRSALIWFWTTGHLCVLRLNQLWTNYDDNFYAVVRIKVFKTANYQRPCVLLVIQPQKVFMHITHDVIHSQPPTLPAPGDCWLQFLKFVMNLKIVGLLCVSFHLIGTFWQGRNPSPDADVISLIEFVLDTIPALFQQICGSDFRLHRPQ